MIPILYAAAEQEFTSEGLGRLKDCTRFEVTEERNGLYECEFDYPMDGPLFEQLKNGYYVAATHDNKGDVQAFQIYKRSAPIKGIVTYNAWHISYKLNSIVCYPFTAANIGYAMEAIKPNSATSNPFAFWTNKSVETEYKLSTPKAVRNILGGEEGSILDVYGKGDYEFDMFNVRLYVDRGSDRGVSIRYGKNMADLSQDLDSSDIVNAVLPYWSNTEGDTVVVGQVINGTAEITETSPLLTEDGLPILTEAGEEILVNYAERRTMPLDLSEYFEEQPTIDELQAKAQSILEGSDSYKLKENIEVDFVQMWQTEEYKDFEPLQQISLCDTVHIYHKTLGINAEAKCIKVVYDSLRERYISMELGEPKTTLAQQISEIVSTDVVEPAKASVSAAIVHATNMITGANGGYVVISVEDGETQEILIMDTPDKETAVNVWRWNMGGLGHSHSGYNGPFDDIAITQDGQINANMITVGTMLANRIKGGTLELGGENNESGIIVIYDADDNEVGRWDNGELESKSLVANDYIYVDGNTSSNIIIPVYDLESSLWRFILNRDGLSLKGNDYMLSMKLGMYDSSPGIGISSPDGGSTTISLGSISMNSGSNGTSSQYTSLRPGAFTVSTYFTKENWYMKRLEADFANRKINIGMDSGPHTNEFTVQLRGSFSVTGTKNRLVSTDDYADRLLYCYETPSPMFGDIGEGVIGEDGTAYVWLDPIFAETIDTYQYQVQLQAYGQGECYVVERKGTHFIVKGEPNLAFGWEIKAKQADYTQRRIDKPYDFKLEQEDYGSLAIEHLYNLKQERMVA